MYPYRHILRMYLPCGCGQKYIQINEVDAAIASPPASDPGSGSLFFVDFLVFQVLIKLPFVPMLCMDVLKIKHRFPDSKHVAFAFLEGFLTLQSDSYRPVILK